MKSNKGVHTTVWLRRRWTSAISLLEFVFKCICIFAVFCNWIQLNSVCARVCSIGCTKNEVNRNEKKKKYLNKTNTQQLNALRTNCGYSIVPSAKANTTIILHSYNKITIVVTTSKRGIINNYKTITQQRNNDTKRILNFMFHLFIEHVSLRAAFYFSTKCLYRFQYR